MAEWRNASSVRGYLMAIIALILVAGFVTTSLLSYQVSKANLRDALIGNELPLTSDNIYSEIQRDLLRPVFVSSMMADDTFVRDWLLDGEQNPDKMTRYLDEIRKKHGMFTSFLVSEKTRNYYHYKGITQVIDENDPADAWYFRVRDMQATHELNVDLNAAENNALTVFINHKVFDYAGNYLATTGVGIAFNALGKVVERYKTHFARHVYFVDATGKIMVRSEGSSITEANILTARHISTIAKALVASDHGFFEYDRAGENMLVSTRIIPELNWRVIVEQQESSALAGIRQTLISNLAVGFGVIALTLLIVLYTVNLFYARLEQKAFEMSALAEQEAMLNEQLKYQSEVKDKLFSIVSHDLIDPFNSLLMGTQMMSKHSEKFSKEKLVDYAEKVNKSGESVFELLRNLLDWSRLQIEGMKLEPKIISLRDLTQESITILGPMAQDKDITVTNRIENDAAFADPDMIQTVIRNLISNALKFTPTGGRVEISAATQAGAKDTMVQITVRDTGIGIEPDRTDKIFALDQKTSTSGTAGEHGTGLGLPLCKEMVEMNGGRIWFESATGEGARFHFTLPVAPG